MLYLEALEAVAVAGATGVVITRAKVPMAKPRDNDNSPPPWGRYERIMIPINGNNDTKREQTKLFIALMITRERSLCLVIW